VRVPTGRIVALAAILLGTVGCGGEAPSAISSMASASLPSAQPSTSPTPSSPATSTSDVGIVVDATLLDILPVAIDGIERRADAESAAEIAATPELGSDVRAIAVAIYVGPLATDTPGDYAVATVVRLQDGVFDEAWFRDWRDSFDAGVCEQAGGVEPGRSEVEIEGRTVHRSTCVGGVVIHHVHLDDQGVVVSVQGSGPADLGRRVVAAVKE
jgi:hypothetical protein